MFSSKACYGDFKVGDTFVAGDNLTCVTKGDVLTIMEDKSGLFFVCSDGRHTIVGRGDGEEIFRPITQGDER